MASDNQTTLEPWQTREAWVHLNDLAKQDHEQQRTEIERLRKFINEVADAPDVMVCRLMRDAAWETLNGRA